MALSRQGRPTITKVGYVGQCRDELRPVGLHRPPVGFGGPLGWGSVLLALEHKGEATWQAM